MSSSGVRSRSLNDLQSLDPDHDRNLFDTPLKSSWSFSNLLVNSDPEERKSSENEEKKKSKPVSTKKRNKERNFLQKFQGRLASQICNVLDEAHENEHVLEELFYNISSTVPPHVAEKLCLDMDRRWYYYELLATHFFVLEKQQPGEVEKVWLPLCGRLWSLEHFPAIFALLFHRWVIETEAGLTSRGWVMRFNVLLKGSYQMFWFDIQHDTRKLWPLYIRIRDNMFSVSSTFVSVHEAPRGGFGHEVKSTASSAKESIRKDFACVLCRFYYYYTTRPERVGIFCLNQLHLEEGLDLFVLQLVLQLRSIRNETVLRRYLKCCAMLSVDSLQLSSKNKLFATLNELILPGAPLYPTAAVRDQAEKTMSTLFPQGQWTRYAINSFFKLLRPFYLPQSIFRYLVSWLPLGGSKQQKLK
uniref:Uncharacterized protein n=1 Tax=Mucochytrium quahogii TaxID=96639 RepID=A0A7S2RS46_9STRA|mmetsp:Transcript_12051/g.19623  ORF Transcript_12051/g.19623 Transcript_12051/m.19623 type:complete len:415 (+) Transcript_12051:65-1309(+)